MPIDRAKPLRELWYYAMPSRDLRPGKVTPRVMLGEPVVIGRDREGAAFALRDLCPHRGIPLSEGRFDGAEVECPYHGWRFDRTGQCTAIPSLAAGDKLNVGRIRVKSYPVTEKHGNVWIFFGDDPATAPEVPALPVIAADRLPDLTLKIHMPCPMDEAVFGEMDPSHNTFVHDSWWWRKRGSLAEKAKGFAPIPYGFTMLPHRPAADLRAYKLLGGAPETQVLFHLPSSRIEYTTFGKHWLVSLNTVTPIDGDNSEMCFAAYWSPLWLKPLKPLLWRALRTFARQDREMLRLRTVGAKYDPTTMLIDDADTQAKWYYRLKREYARSLAEKRPFVNPVEPRVLRFRS